MNIKHILFVIILYSFYPMVIFGQFDSYPIYNGNDLGVIYSPKETTFKVWAPTASELKLTIYPDGHLSNKTQEISMAKGESGVWYHILKGDFKNKYYTYRAKINGEWNKEVPDIYAKAVGVNGKRGMIVDLKSTNPIGWKQDKSPAYGTMKDAILYELHVRDATIFTKSKHKGKYLGLTETKLMNSKGQKAGLDHIIELGVTHVHLLPVYDYYTVDESIKDNPQYNWGYDPLNYNAPEGNYSTNPFLGEVRIKEFKQMVQALHKNGLNVVMDVVYNHTMFGKDSYFNQLVPDYYYRQNKEGKFSDASACGNETASDRYMFRKFMIESLVHWVTEYHIDGFRFDLMAIHDIETMNEIAKTLRAIKPNIVLYGEGWTAAESPLPEAKMALKKHAYLLDDIAVFCDDIRDGAKGSVFKSDDTGFVTGKKGTEESIKFGLIGAGKHTSVDYKKVNYSKEPFTKEPYQMISYTECHDNHTLWDRFLNSIPTATEDEKVNLQMLSLGIVLTSQGIPFIHAGQEFCRTKKGEENSYKSSDEINGINWERKSEYQQVNEFTKKLIKLRKEHPAFRLGSQSLVQKHVSFPTTEDGIILMKIENAPNDQWREIYIAYNSRKEDFNLEKYISKTALLKLNSKNTSELDTKSKKLRSQSFMIFAN